MNNVNELEAYDFGGYKYYVTKDGEEFEFDSYDDMVSEVQQWADVSDKIYEFESNLDDKFPIDCEEEREMWLTDTIEEILDEAGYSVNKVMT